MKANRARCCLAGFLHSHTPSRLRVGLSRLSLEARSRSDRAEAVRQSGVAQLSPRANSPGRLGEMPGVSPRNELRRLSTAHSKLFNRLNSTAVISTVTVNCTCLSSFANVSDIAQATTLGNRLGDLLINFLGAWLAAFDRANRNSRVFKCVSASDDHE